MHELAKCIQVVRELGMGTKKAHAPLCAKVLLERGEDAVVQNLRTVRRVCRTAYEMMLSSARRDRAW